MLNKLSKIDQKSFKIGPKLLLEPLLRGFWAHLEGVWGLILKVWGSSWLQEEKMSQKSVYWTPSQNRKHCKNTYKFNFFA